MEQVCDKQKDFHSVVVSKKFSLSEEEEGRKKEKLEAEEGDVFLFLSLSFFKGEGQVCVSLNSLSLCVFSLKCVVSRVR